MPYPAKPLLIGSVTAYSGKSAAILGLVPQIVKRGFGFAYGKPLSLRLGTTETAGSDLDVQFIVSALKLKESQVIPSILTLNEADIRQQLSHPSTGLPNLFSLPTQVDPDLDLLILEGPGSLAEGQLFGCSLLDQATQLDAAVVLMVRCQSLGVVDELLGAQGILGDRLYGVILNDIPSSFAETVVQSVVAYLETHHIQVFGQIPSHPLLRSISVREIVHQLQAEVLCCSDRLNLMVEQLTIGAMNVNSALRYFNRASNMAVVTGGDRTDIQLAALEASTNCLILTGHFLPNSIVINRAEDLEVPILSVDLDTLTTVELVDKAFIQARFSETIKVDCIQQLFKKHVDVDRLLDRLNLKPPVRI